MIKILITGPESSGKSFLAKKLATHFKTEYVPEYARIYLNGRTSYSQPDLLKIALGQMKSEDNEQDKGLKVLFCDTGPEVVKIWSEVRYNNVNPKIEALFQSHKYDLILLCKPNLPWVYDPLRENKENRDELFLLYRSLLATQSTSVIEINQSKENRVDQAIKVIVEFLKTVN